MSMDNRFKITQKESNILNLIACNEDANYSRKIANILGKNESTVSRLLSKLKDKGLIKVSSHSTAKFYKLTLKGYKALVEYQKNQTGKKSICLRSHRRRVKFPLKQGYEKLKNSKYAEKINEELRNTEEVYIRLEDQGFEEITGRITKSNLFINIPEQIYPPTERGVWQAGEEALEKATVIKNMIKSEFPSVKFGRGRPIFSNKHHALVHHPFALAIDNLDEEGVISNCDLLTIKVDRSTGCPELEIENSKKQEYPHNLANNTEYIVRNDLRDIEKRIENLEEWKESCCSC